MMQIEHSVQKSRIKTNKNRSLRCFKGVDKRVCHRGIYFGSIATLDFVSAFHFQNFEFKLILVSEFSCMSLFEINSNSIEF